MLSSLIATAGHRNLLWTFGDKFKDNPGFVPFKLSIFITLTGYPAMKIPHNATMMKLMFCASITLFVGNCLFLAYQYQVVNKFVSKSIYLNDGERLTS